MSCCWGCCCCCCCCCCGLLLLLWVVIVVVVCYCCCGLLLWVVVVVVGCCCCCGLWVVVVVVGCCCCGLLLFGTRLMTVYDHMTPVLPQLLRLIYTEPSIMKNSSSSRAPAALSSKKTRRKLPRNGRLGEIMSRFQRASRTERTATRSIDCARKNASGFEFTAT